jgi:trehalose-phosphatase
MISDAERDQRLDEIARSSVLLVVSDFDGTIAPIAAEPAAAEVDRETAVALRGLSQMPQTHVAIISGRALADLAGRVSGLEDAYLVGSHGSEFEAGFIVPLESPAHELLGRLKAALRPLAAEHAGMILEEKPASLAFHYRLAAEADAANAVNLILGGPAAWPGVHVRHGKKVIELSVVRTDKGAALQRLRQRLGASAVLFLGDDVTDEDAFTTLSGPDVGVKVGLGPSRATCRARDTLEVSQILARVSEQRLAWLAGSQATPIDQHSLLSDQRSVALVDAAGRVVWMCLPRIDSAALFAELIGGPTAGFFEVRPADHLAPGRPAYRGDTFVLQTRWPSITVTDYLDCSAGRAWQRPGRTDLVRVIEGRGPICITFAPRLDFGRVETHLRATPDGVEVEGSIEPLVLRGAGLPWRVAQEGRHHTATAVFDLGAQPVVLEMRYGTASMQAAVQPESVRRRHTERFWSDWAATLCAPATARDAVRRSALVLRALTYGPTGAIAAAATSSLPEHLGGVRNWDYRFCWPRDAAMAAGALARLGPLEPAIRFLDWVLAILDQLEPAAMLCPVYTAAGGHLGPEGEIRELAGYCGSRPVRIGNAAAQQIQLDVCAPIVELVAILAEHGAALSSEHWRMIETMVDVIGRRWAEPDHGIWEVRRARQHHVHSRVMCWLTVDRALRVAQYLGRRTPGWAELRARIRDDILVNGWNAGRRAFCATYDGGEPDAAALAVGLSGLLEPNDERFLGTIDFVERELRSGPTVHRYRYDDGLPGVEGGFHLCTAWLIESYVLAGRRSAAEELWAQLLALAGPTGLLSEEYDPGTGRALGNVPQAYSHIGIIQAALRLDGQDLGPPLPGAS